MAQKDWDEIITLFEQKKKGYIKKFLKSENIFCPNDEQHNIFSDSNDFSSKDLNKNSPANWIPNYSRSTLSNYLLENHLMPIRSGKGSFFFYKGNIFLNIDNYASTDVKIDTVKSIYPFLPLSLSVDFQKNENAYINKALSLGIINHFIESNEILLHGQSGVIKLSEQLEFKTSKGLKHTNRGLQFEVDMVLETKNEILIFEAKKPTKKFTKEFSLLQLYYPFIYFSKITDAKKKIRTIFFDVLVIEQEEKYKLIEVNFLNGFFNTYDIKKNLVYTFIHTISNKTSG